MWLGSVCELRNIKGSKKIGQKQHAWVNVPIIPNDGTMDSITDERSKNSTPVTYRREARKQPSVP
jgi:hypothetical protein